MDPNVINGVLRALVPSMVAYAVASGWMPSDTVAPDVAAALVTTLAAIWSVASNSDAWNLNVANGVVRAVVPAVIAYLVGKGWMPADTSAPDVTAAILTLLAAGWSVKTNLGEDA